MASLRTNVLVSTAATVLIGLIRPGFNAVVNRAFGPEVNGHAATLIAIIFLAALPATAALPTAMVRHVSRALGAGRREEAAGHGALATKVGAALVGLGIGAALLHGLYRADPPLTGLEAVFVAAGIAGYAFWRLFRTLLLAVGRAVASLWAEALAVLVLGAALAALVIFDRPEWAVGAFSLVYVVFVLAVLPSALSAIRGGRLDRAGRRSFARYNLLWFGGAAASLATREIMVLILDQRVERAVVGELSVALSLLMMLAFAPRIIEVPLVHELSSLAGQNDAERQRRLTSTTMHWLGIFTFAAGCGASVLAGPILAVVGDVHTPVIALAFAVIAFAFTSEMMVTPATNLLIAEAHPAVLAIIGVGSLAGAFLWWGSPLSGDMMGIVYGLGLSYAIKAVGIAWYARVKFQVEIFRQPIRKVVALASGAGAVAAVLNGAVHPWLAFVGFEAIMLALFHRDALEVYQRLIVGRRGPDPA